MSSCYVRVVYPIPLDETFWYRKAIDVPVEIGMRVEAPLGKRPKATGYVIEVYKPDAVPSLPPDLAAIDPNKNPRYSPCGRYCAALQCGELIACTLAF